MKEVAQTIKDMVASEAMTTVIDRTSSYEDVIDIANTVVDHWSYDLFKRNPKPALVENGVLKPTDLDLACFMSALAERRAAIVLPKYEGRRAKTITEGERVVSSQNRTGKIIGLVANRDVFSFSVRIEDTNVISSSKNGEDKVGAPRNFMLTDLDGSFWRGWDAIEFMPSAKENEFLEDKNLWTGHTVHFKNFVHPNRWASLYGQYYFLTKALIERLSDQASWFRVNKKRLLDEGIRFPVTGESGAKKEWPKSTKGSSRSEKFTAFEAEIDAPWKGEFGDIPSTQEALVEIERAARLISYSIVPRLRFHARATELAFFQAGMDKKGFPSWIKNAQWESGYVQEGKRKEWNRLVLHQLLPGQTGFAIRFRTFQKSEQVAS